MNGFSLGLPRLAVAVLLGAWLGEAAALAEVKVTSRRDAVAVEIDGQPFTTFVLRGGDAMKPYLHPLRAASGKIVSRHFPMEKVEGEPTDHPHQRGLWFSHERVNGFDFWNNEASYKTANRGRIEVNKVDEAKSGETGRIKATLSWLDPGGKRLIEEKQTMVFAGGPEARTIDFDITLRALEKVTFGDAKDGTLGVRLAPALQEVADGHGAASKVPATGKITNAEGQTGEKAVWGKLSNWVDYSGTLEGEKVGVTMFAHPGNSRPTRWHVRGYGLFAANPFGVKVFTKDKAEDGSFTLEAGGRLRFRYRVLIHSGDAASAGVAKGWEEYVKASE